MVTALVERLTVPDGDDTRQLAIWAFGDPPDPADRPMAEAEHDARALAAAPAQLQRLQADHLDEHPIPEPAYAAGGLYLLGRLGDELALRERAAWDDQDWPADRRDPAIAALWGAMFDRGFDPDVADGVRKAFGRDVRRAFRGVALGLSLPPSVAELRAEQALEALETLSWGAHVDVAARVVETAGEPIAALGSTLGPAGWSDVCACIAGRQAWMDAWTLLLGTPRPAPDQLDPCTLSTGVELVVALRTIAALSRGAARPHALGLPGWGIVVANRSRIRGRLRVIARKDPARLRERLLSLDGLRARTAAALSRWAWEWAWREARTGFGFDLAGLQPPPCVLPEPTALPLPPLEDADAPLVRTVLLALLARGCWDELERWLSGEGRGLSARFYRVLADVPAPLVDPGTEASRSRGYTRLREHLSDGGLTDYLDDLRTVALRVVDLPPGRARKAALHDALRPDWRPDAIDLPARGADEIVGHFQAFATGTLAGIDLATLAARDDDA